MNSIRRPVAEFFVLSHDFLSCYARCSAAERSEEPHSMTGSAIGQFMGVESGGGGGGGDASPPVTNLGGDVPPDSRMMWPKSNVFPIFGVF